MTVKELVLDCATNVNEVFGTRKLMRLNLPSSAKKIVADHFARSGREIKQESIE